MKDFLLGAFPFLMLAVAVIFLTIYIGKIKGIEGKQAAIKDDYMVEGMVLGMIFGLILGDVIWKDTGTATVFGMLVGMVLGMTIDK